MGIEESLPNYDPPILNRPQTIPRKKSPKIKFEATQGLIYKGYFGVWSIQQSFGETPEPRRGHFTACCDNMCFIGCGLSEHNNLLNDIWAFNLDILQWTRLNLEGALPPRQGSKAVAIQNFIFVFGGRNSKHYFNDFHIIDLNANCVREITTTGNIPSPRSSPVVAYYGQQFFVWGGYDDTPQDGFFCLDLNTFVWNVLAHDLPPRFSIPFVQLDRYVYGYGGSKQEGLLVLDLENQSADIIPCTGTPPPPSLIQSGMVQCGSYIFFFGGKAQTSFSKLWVLDLTRKIWHVFTLGPDGSTTSIFDGEINSKGDLLIPRMHSFTMVYSESKRAVLMFLGSPNSEPPSATMIEIGEALSVLHMREDLLSILDLTSSPT